MLLAHAEPGRSYVFELEPAQAFGARRDDLVQSLARAFFAPDFVLVDRRQHDPLIQARTKGIGTLTADQIRKFGALGPTARASGVDIDVRRVAWRRVLEQSDEARRQQGLAARRRIELHYSLTAVTAQYTQEYESVVRSP